VWLVATTPLCAQTQPGTPAPKAKLEFDAPAEPPPIHLAPSSADDAYRIWARGEYLLWWTKNGPAPALVTTGSSADAFPGALGQPGTRVLFGDSGLNYGSSSGFRIILGGWFDCDNTIGIEGSGFMLQQRSTGFSAASDPLGNPALYLPVYRADLGREGVYRVADPVVGLNGNLNITSQSRLWDAEVNGIFNAVRNKCMSIDLLAGFRYADLTESLTINTDSTDFINNIRDVTTDSFATRNQYYAGQIGIRGAFRYDRFMVEAGAKVALGVNHENVAIGGLTTESGAGSTNPGMFPGGVFAQPSNLGSTFHNQFAVMPEVQLKLAYQVRPNVSAYVGYDFLYWNQVVRPGAQIDHSINPTQSLGGGLTGPAAPLPQFNHTDYWAHGVSFGVEIRY
jgi:hypothetical protein